MPRLRFSPPAGLFAGAPLLESLLEMPPATKAVIRAGFSAVAQLPPNSREVLLKTAMRRLQDQSLSAPDEELASTLGLEKETAGTAVAAATLLTVIIVSSKASAADFVAAAAKAELLTDDAKEAVTALANSVERDRADTSASLDQISLANRLLPSLLDFETVIDVRLRFEKGKVTAGVPVVIVHIDTDAAHEELWFQMTKAQTERLSTSLSDLLRDLEKAEHVASSAASVAK